ncbi:MAG: FAD-dependent oxidoreductase [Mariprofundaceae bacterium]
MNQPNKLSHDILIVGSGLAGSSLAYRLMQSGKRVLLIADPDTPSASRVAAGLINPVTGQRLVLQNNIEALLATALSFYHQLEELFDQKLLHSREMLRVIRNEKEAKAWKKRKEDPAYKPYLGDFKESNSDINAPAGLFSQHHTGFLDTNRLLDSLHRHFLEQQAMQAAKVHYNDISVTPDGVQWQDIHAKQMIFCEGWRGSNNPWFNHLPFQPAKGEIVTFYTDFRLPEHIINAGNWIIPIDQHTFKLGATYDWNVLDESVTDDAKEKLMQAMNQIFVDPPKSRLIEQSAGVRPGSRDKEPFIGFHHEHPQLGIFNGFGSKGSLLTPWYSEVFARHITHGDALPASANITRFNG